MSSRPSLVPDRSGSGWLPVREPGFVWIGRYGGLFGWRLAPAESVFERPRSKRRLVRRARFRWDELIAGHPLAFFPRTTRSAARSKIPVRQAPSGPREKCSMAKLLVALPRKSEHVKCGEGEIASSKTEGFAEVRIVVPGHVLLRQR